MLWISLLLLLGNAFFVGAEFAVMAARRSQLEPMAAEGSKRASAALEALENVASLLACAQLGITVCSVLLGAVAEDAVHHLIAGPLEATGMPDGLTHVVSLLLALLIVAYFHVVLRFDAHASHDGLADVLEHRDERADRLRHPQQCGREQQRCPVGPGDGEVLPVSYTHLTLPTKRIV